ncbi:autophagy-related protein 16 [Lasiosphaeria miniovina]|uniref:Autophagy-related protein 16 n=1 Tax=Lasiosphaeria miniovina TaxID=1954250 RepID=A0AA40AUU9_9PEZI|nr:autophagy-related protein 16 [Lasiosphaeria miniovina]KAK0722445.1 autophagy-related protein 16 [Lasiosphaeria miniovina]
MSGWRDEFLKGIRDAERQQNPASREIIDACSHLVDRVSSLEAEKAALQALSETSPLGSKGTAGSPTPDVHTASDARLRFDLAEALRGKGQFQNRLQAAEEELVRLRTRTAADAKMIRDLTAERRTLTIKLRDREEELRVKNKLVADVQDELAVLNMQLDMEEKRRRDKEVENKQLVERYIQRVSQEADAMNRANEPYSRNGRA